MANITDNGAVFHFPHMVNGNHIAVASGGDKYISLWCGLFHRHNLIAFHRRLQGTNRVDFSHHNTGPALTK